MRSPDASLSRNVCIGVRVRVRGCTVDPDRDLRRSGYPTTVYLSMVLTPGCVAIVQKSPYPPLSGGHFRWRTSAVVTRE